MRIWHFNQSGILQTPEDIVDIIERDVSETFDEQMEFQTAR